MDLIFNQLNTFPGPLSQLVINYSWWDSFRVMCYLCKHWLPVLGDHGALITVQGDAGVVEGLLGVFENVVELGDPSLEHRAEITGNQRPADRCRETKEKAGC